MTTLRPGDRVVFVGASRSAPGTSHVVRRADGARLETRCGLKRSPLEVLDREPAREPRDGDCARC